VAAVVAQNGLTGLPAKTYDPVCAMACVRSLYTLSLSCSTGGGIIGMVAFTTSTECWAKNDEYLTSLAYCMHTRCESLGFPDSKLETFWEQQATGQTNAGVRSVPAKWSFAQALAQVSSPPTFTLAANATELNETSLVNSLTYQSQFNVLYGVQRETSFENLAGQVLTHTHRARWPVLTFTASRVIILCVGFTLPILLTWSQLLPVVGRLIRKSKPYILWPSTIGSYSVRPLPFLLGNAPTVGQALYVLALSILTVVLCCVNYKSFQPSAWYLSSYYEVFAYAMYRTGEIAYIISPLIFLFASRNNILQWLTNWSHSTYLVLHRWVARIYALLAILHSILALILYKKNGRFAMDASMLYWKWGIVATVVTTVLAFFSGLHFRRSSYEVWLLIHILLSVILIVGCWYHAYTLYKFLGGVFYFLCAASAVWFLDRIGRIARLVGVGPRYAKVTDLGSNYVRIDIPAVRWGADPGKHVYVYFPTLRPMRFWENHPFSVLPTHLLGDTRHVRHIDSMASSQHGPQDLEKIASKPTSIGSPPANTVYQHPGAGLTLYVRKATGMTRYLEANSSLLTFIEGPYRNNSSTAILRCDRVLLICGGIGITGLLPFAHNHWNVKLAWSLRESAQCLYNEMEPSLHGILDKDIRIGRRLDIGALLAEEAALGWERVGVVACGPASMCDEVRATLIRVAKSSNKTEFEFEVEAYTW
jgi:hypothetical protein